MSSREDEDQEWIDKFWGKIVASVFILPLVMWIWSWAVPFGFFEFWNYRGTPGEWVYAAWPIFAWAVGASVAYAVFTRNERWVNRDAEDILKGGTLTSLQAGVIEEILFRWLFFLWNIVSVKIGNFVFFGFLGFGLPSWFHLNIAGPIANWATFHGLESYIFHPTGWAVGASMLITNSFFRDGHKYQGLIGFFNSWFIGMYLFWIMFQYGLPAAILIHFLYDFLIFLVRYIDAVIERALGWT